MLCVRAPIFAEDEVRGADVQRRGRTRIQVGG